MGHIDYCSLCKYVYTKDCNYGSKECNQEKARIMLEVSRFEKRKTSDNCCIVCGHKVQDGESYYDVNGATICKSCMGTCCPSKQ